MKFIHYGSKVDNDGYIISIIDKTDEIHKKKRKMIYKLHPLWITMHDMEFHLIWMKKFIYFVN